MLPLSMSLFSHVVYFMTSQTEARRDLAEAKAQLEKKNELLAKKDEQIAELEGRLGQNEPKRPRRSARSHSLMRVDFTDALGDGRDVPSRNVD